MNIKQIMLISGSSLLIACLAIYTYSSWKLANTRQKISQTIEKMQELKTSLTEQKEQITTVYLPQVKNFSAQKNKYAGLFEGLNLIKIVKRFTPVAESIPLPRMNRELKQKFDTLFDTLDDLLRHATKDLKRLVRTIEQTVPQIETVIGLHEKTLGQLAEVSALATIRRVVGF